MATGEKRFTTTGRTVKKFENTPLPAGDYELKLRGDSAEIGKRPEPGKLPYITVQFEVLGTGGESGRNRILYHTLFLSTEPGKDGSVMTDRADQLVGLARGMGVDINAGTREAKKAQPDGTLTTVEIVDPNDIVRWLKANDGAIVQAHTKIKKGTKEYPNDKAVISYFVETETSGMDALNDDADQDLANDDDMTNGVVETTVRGKNSTRATARR